LDTDHPLFHSLNLFIHPIEERGLLVRRRHELSEMARLTLVKTERREVTLSPLFFVTPSASEGSLFSPPPGKRGEISRSARKDRVGVALAKARGLSGDAVPNPLLITSNLKYNLTNALPHFSLFSILFYLSTPC
jgi:hypothetical protein